MKISVRSYHIILKALKVLLAAVMLALAGFLVFLGLQVSGRSKLGSGSNGAVPELALSELSDSPEPVPPEGGSPQAADRKAAPEDEWQEGDVRYQGVHYRYNKDILTFLFLGIDKLSEAEPVKDGIDGGQSDAIFLLVLNPHIKEISVIAIPRDTMAEIDVYDNDGVFVTTALGQLTLQHGYGDGAAVSCEHSMRAVQRLFYNLPIHGYCAVNMGAIPLINDAVGGVEVEALEDVIHTGIKKGDVVLLKGMDAYYYLHNRDTKSPGSAARRLERQKQYLEGYAAAAMEAVKSDFTIPVVLYNKLKPYMVTDISLDEIAYLAVEASGYRFDSGSLYSLEGETVMGERYEEFYIDETALYELILQVFYEEAED